MYFSTAGRSRLELGEDPGDRLVREDDAVLGVIDDVAELLAGEPEIDRVQDRPQGRDGEIELEVPMMIPGAGGDPVAGMDTQAPQCVHEADEPGPATSPYVIRCSVPSPQRLTISFSGKNWAARSQDASG